MSQETPSLQVRCSHCNTSFKMKLKRGRLPASNVPCPKCKAPIDLTAFSDADVQKATETAGTKRSRPAAELLKTIIPQARIFDRSRKTKPADTPKEVASFHMQKGGPADVVKPVEKPTGAIVGRLTAQPRPTSDIRETPLMGMESVRSYLDQSSDALDSGVLTSPDSGEIRPGPRHTPVPRGLTPGPRADMESEEDLPEIAIEAVEVEPLVAESSPLEGPSSESELAAPEATPMPESAAEPGPEPISILTEELELEPPSAEFEIPAPGLKAPSLPKPGLAKPGLPKLELPKPELPKPGLPKPGLPKLELPKPSLPKVDLPTPGVPTGELAKPSLPKVELPEPEVANLPVAEPEVAEPEVVKPEVASLPVAEPEVAEPEVAEPEVAPEPTFEAVDVPGADTAAPDLSLEMYRQADVGAEAFFKSSAEVAESMEYEFEEFDHAQQSRAPFPMFAAVIVALIIFALIVGLITMV